MNIVSVLMTIAESQNFSPKDKLTECVSLIADELFEEELDFVAAAADSGINFNYFLKYPGVENDTK